MTSIESTFKSFDDIELFYREWEHEDVFIIANSVAGVTASTWVHDYAPKVRGMALIAPAFKIKLYFPFAKEFLKLAVKFKPKMSIKSYVKSKFLTHEIEEQKYYDEDTLITPNIPATKDYVVDSKVQGDFYALLASPLKKFVQLEGFYHGILYEIQTK